MQEEDKPKTQIDTDPVRTRLRNAELEHAESGRRRALDDLRDSETRFRSLAESAVDAIISIDANDRIIYWNPGATKIFGYREEEALGRSATMLIPEHLREAHRKGVERFLRTGNPVLIGRVAEVQAVRKDGTAFDAELSISTWKTREGQFFSGIIRDISDRKEAERALEKSSREARERTVELESLIQMVAHDLKSPVIAMVGLVRALKNRLAKRSPDPGAVRILEQLTATGTSMELFLRDLLEGLVSDHIVLESAPVALDSIIHSIVNQQSPLLKEKHITVRVELRPDVPAVYADERRVRQVIDNILCNAIRHMGERPEPHIRIQVSEQEGFVLTRISDNGIGIPEEYRLRIFDRFFRVPKTQPSGGTGLGLAISRKIIEKHGGRIWVESEEGQGATFLFTLPKYNPLECVS